MSLPPITKKQKQILFFLYKFRFITVKQFLILFNHKDPKRIKEWLKDLKGKKYIYAIEDKKDMTKPYIYCLDTKARHVLKKDEDIDKPFLGRIYKEKKLTAIFINHCLFIVDTYLYFLTQKDPSSELHFFTQQDLKGYDFLPKYQPDVYISVERNGQRDTYFLDVFDEYRYDKNIPIMQLRQYLDYSESGEWQVNTSNSDFPAILFVFQYEIRKKHIYHYGKAKLEKSFDAIELFLTTQNSIRYGNGNVNIWQKVE